MLPAKQSIQLQPLVGRFLGFALVGAVGTAAHYGLLAIQVEYWHVPVLVATTVGFAVGGFINYTLSRRLVFASTAMHAVALPKFFVVAVIGATINYLSVAWLTRDLGLHYLVAQVCSTGVVLFWNFAANHVWTFRQ